MQTIANILNSVSLYWMHHPLQSSTVFLTNYLYLLWQFKWSERERVLVWVILYIIFNIKLPKVPACQSDSTPPNGKHQQVSRVVVIIPIVNADNASMQEGASCYGIEMLLYHWACAISHSSMKHDSMNAVISAFNLLWKGSTARVKPSIRAEISVALLHCYWLLILKVSVGRIYI